MKHFVTIIVTALFTILTVAAQPDRELRAVWLTSVYNIDWPHQTGVSALNQQNRLRSILNGLQESNFNAVLFQVRPNADALYQSAYEPWSQWITGTRGNDPGYDPLAFLIEEANKRGIEVHVWLNPYRFENTAGQYAGLPGDYSQTHPELIFNVGGRTFFDPGIPATTQLIKKIVADLVTNYDIDGVVFDDYFYPSAMTNAADQQTYNTYGTLEFVSQWYPTLTRGNFRRASVNNMVREVNDTIKAIKPHILFGVSPAGIYSTQQSAAQNWGTTLPQGITGNDNYNVIYCDPLAWLHDQSVDYISPQLYWVIGGNQDFVTLTEWWGYQAKRHDRHSYPSLASYRLYSSKSGEPGEVITRVQKRLGHESPENDMLKFNWPLSEIGNQIIANRENPNNLAQGIIFYNTTGVLNPTKDLAGYLAGDLFSQKTILPLIPWFETLQPGGPQIAQIGVVGGMDENVAGISIENTPAERFLLYGWEDQPAKDTEDGFLQVVFGKDFSTFYPAGKNYFAVQEYMPDRDLGTMSEAVSYEYLVPASLISPNDEIVCDGFLFDWVSVADADHYRLLISRQQSPGSVYYTSPVLENSSYALEAGILPGQENFIFRVMAVAGASVSWSDFNPFFTGHPRSTQVNSPASGAENVPLTTVVQWSSADGAVSYHVQIATHESFDEESLVIDQQPVNLNVFSASLNAPAQEHFVRVRGINDCGYAFWSLVNSFTTTDNTFIDAPVVTQLRAFPNPTAGNFRVVYPYMIGKRSIVWYDLQGRVIASFNRANNVQTEAFDLSAYPAGYYHIRIETSEGERFVTRIIKTQE